MSLAEFFQWTGSAAGLISLFWLIGTNLFGTHDSKTIRNALEQCNHSNQKMIEQMGKMAKEISRASRRRGST